MGLSPNARGPKHAACALAACVVAVACGTARDAVDARPPPVEAAPVEERADIDLQALIDRVHFSFRAYDGELVGAHATYEARVARDGALTVSPSGGAAARLATAIDGAAPSPRVRLLDDGDVEIDRGAARERLHATAEGLEQSWTFDRAPAPAGDLVVRVKIGGYTEVAETEAGHHLRGAGGAGLVRYGHATWIDAAGARTPVRGAWDGGAIVMKVPRALVDRSAFPATLDPIIGPELAIDAPLPRPAGPATMPSVAPGPNGTFLAVWEDSRPGLGSAIMATRVSADGTPLGDNFLVPLLATGTNPARASVAYDSVGSRWLVVTAKGTKVGGVRIDAAGTLLDKTPFELFDAGPNRVDAISAAFDGAKWFVAASGYSRVGAVFVDPAGKPSAPVDLPPGGAIAAAQCESATCAVLLGSVTAQLVRLSKAGAVLDPTGIALGSGYPTALASDGNQYLALYGSTASNGSALRAKRVASDGTVLDATPITLTSSPGSRSYSSGATWNGSRFVVVDVDGQSLTAQRVAPDGTLEDPSPVTVSAYASGKTAPAIAASGTQHYVVWSDFRHPEPAIYGARMDASSTFPDGEAGTLLSRGSNPQAAPTVAAAASRFLVAWTDERSGTPEIWAARLSASGAPEGSPVLVSAGPAVRPVVASDGTSFLVAWREGTALRAKRVSGTDGTVLDAQPITATTTMPTYGDGQVIAATFDGQSYVLAWSDWRYHQFSGSDMFAARVSTAGVLLDPQGILVSSAVSAQYDPALASDGNTTLLVWADGRSDHYAGDLYGARLDRSGAVLDESSFLVAASGFDQVEPAIAWDGASYVVAWADTRRTAGRAADIYATRVTAAGKSLDTSGTLVASVPGKSLGPPLVAAMGDGVTNLVLWDELGAGQPTSIKGAFLRAATGEVLDQPALAIVPGPLSAAVTGIAPAGAGKALVTYQQYVAASGSQRALARLVDSGQTPGAACTQAVDCRSRHCRDAVCCAEPCDGPCRKCGADGACVAVISADDDACAGSCDATGACKKKNGDVCAIGSECASGFCIDGFCCNTACEGACDVCNAPRGVCSIVPAGTRGTPSCAPAVCNGFDAVCPARCATDDECADGFGCDRPSGQCVSGAVCSDDHVLRAPNGIETDCRPYGCSAGACRTSCTQVTDCIYPAACDEIGRCVAPRPDQGSGSCTVASGPRSSASSFGWIAGVLATGALRRRRRTR